MENPIEETTKLSVLSKPKIIGLVIFVLLLAGGAVYYFKQKAKKESPEETKEEKETPQEPATVDTTGALQEKADKTTIKKQLSVATDIDKPA